MSPARTLMARPGSARLPSAATSTTPAIEPGALVLVSNGNYAPLQAPDLLNVRSVNGPLFTVINGDGTSSCASLVNSASLSGFTLTNGAGGANGGTVSNCTLSGNSS